MMVGAVSDIGNGPIGGSKKDLCTKTRTKAFRVPRSTVCCAWKKDRYFCVSHLPRREVTEKREPRNRSGGRSPPLGTGLGRVGGEKRRKGATDASTKLLEAGNRTNMKGRKEREGKKEEVASRFWYSGSCSKKKSPRRKRWGSGCRERNYPKILTR